MRPEINNRPIIGRLFGADNRPKHYRCTSIYDSMQYRTVQFLSYTQKCRRNYHSSGGPYSIVGAAWDDEWVSVLEAGYAALVTVERAHKLTRRHVPDFDGPVTRRRDDVATVKVDHVHSGAVTDEHAPKTDVRRRVHVPHGHRPVLTHGYTDALYCITDSGWITTMTATDRS